MMRGFALGWVFLVGLLLLGLLVLIILLIVRLASSPRNGQMNKPMGFAPPISGTNAKALEILAERYAKSEIDEAEYKKKKAELTGL